MFFYPLLHPLILDHIVDVQSLYQPLHWEH